MATASPWRACEVSYSSISTVEQLCGREAAYATRRLTSLSVSLHPVLDLTRPYMIVPVIVKSVAS